MLHFNELILFVSFNAWGLACCSVDRMSSLTARYLLRIDVSKNTLRAQPPHQQVQLNIHLSADLSQEVMKILDMRHRRVHSWQYLPPLENGRSTHAVGSTYHHLRMAEPPCCWQYHPCCWQYHPCCWQNHTDQRSLRVLLL